MWSGLNDSFSAITGTINANISNLRQSIPTSFGEGDKREEESRQVKTKLELLRDEVARHRSIALLYKSRWRQAEEILSQATGAPLPDYDDDLLLRDDLPAAALAPQSPSSTTTATTDPSGLSEIPLHDEPDEEEENPTDSASTPLKTILPPSHPPSVDDLALDSATAKIHQLEDELKKVDSDRQHWRSLAKQKSTLEEELETARRQLQNYTTELAQCRSQLEEALASKGELESALQELDAQHETALKAVIRLRDEALEKLAKKEAEMAAAAVKQADVELPRQHDTSQSDASTMTRHDTAPSLIDVNDATATTAIETVHLHRLSALLEPKLTSDDLANEVAVIDGVITKMGQLEMQLELAAGSNRELEARLAVVQEEAERKLRRQDELLEEVEAVNEQLSEQLELMRKSGGSGRSSAAAEVPNEDSKQTIDQLTEEIEKQNKELTKFQKRVEELVTQNRQLEDDGQQKQKQFESQVIELKRKLDAQADVTARLEAEVELQEAKATNLNAQLQETASEVDQVNRCFKKAEGDLAEKEVEVGRLQEMIGSLERQLEEMQISATVAEATSLQPEELLRQEPEGAEPESVESMEAASEEVVKAIQAELAEVLEEREHLRAEVERLKTASGRLETDLDQMVQERKELMTRLTELQSIEADYQQLRPAYDQLYSQYQTLSAEYQKAVDQVTSLTADLTARASSSEKDTEELVQLKEAVKRMSGLVQAKDGEVCQLREKVAQLEADVGANRAAGSEAIRLQAELDRLRVHLVEVEENYTAELMVAEQRAEELTQKLEQMTTEAEASVEAEEQLRTLRTARDKARNEVSTLEDKLQSYSASIANLQAVIEQLEKDHERKVRALEADHQAALEGERAQTAAVVRKLAAQEERLRSTLEALEAASRLSETIDQKEFAISQLKREVSLKCQEITHLHGKIHDLESSYEGKVDKQIVKSLLISLFATAVGSPARTEAERLVARFLDFNQEEMSRAGIRIGRSAANNKGNDSFTSKFVEFLEAESKKTAEGGGGVATTGSGSRKDSTASLPSGTAELARDLNKRMAGGVAAHSRPSAINPFVPHPSNSNSSSQGHHRTPSTASTGSTASFEHLVAGNALFAGSGSGPSMTPILLTSGGPAAGHSVTEMLRDAMEEKGDQII